MDDDLNLEQRLKIVEAQLSALVGSSQYQFQRDAKFYDGRNIQVGQTTGTMIGTTALQKLGFYGSTPIVKPTATDLPSVISLLQALGLSH